MTRRPRALLPRLAHIEREIEAAAALLPQMIVDAEARQAEAEETHVRLSIVASLVAVALLLHRLDPRVLNALVDALGPEGDIEEAEELAATLVEQAWATMAEGEGH